MEKILITGGAGYIGSHVAKLLNHNKKEIIVFDNLSIGKKKYVKHGIFFKGDLRNKSHLYKIFSKYKIKSVIHLAANCLVGESQNKVDEYYENNVVGTINLLDVMIKFKVKNIPSFDQGAWTNKWNSCSCTYDRRAKVNKQKYP